jgi:ribosome-associated protein
VGVSETRRDITPEDRDAVRAMTQVAARAAAAKKGEDTIILEVGRVLAITEAFVITSGTNARQVRTIAEEIEAKIKADGGRSPLRTEGLDDARWVLLDYSDFVVHVFLDEVRRFYDLERLWSDSPRWTWEEGDQTAASGG